MNTIVTVAFELRKVEDFANLKECCLKQLLML